MGYTAQPIPSRLFDSHKPGLRYSILKIEWPRDKDPQQLSNFETLARRLRYMALGQACLKHNIQSLLVAHHMDDQAETVLMRIAQGHRGTGLKGILPVSEIPECWAVHGIHQSGASEATEKVEKRIKARLGQRYQNKNPPKQDIVRESSPPLKIEDGGITVYRPFLGFEKERLKATCRASQVRWIEDKTNQNPALTPRNAIRQLLQLERLPKAIQTASLSALAKRMERKQTTRTTRAENMFGLCDIIMLDTRVGAMTVRFICKPFDRSPIPALHVHQAILNKEYHFAMMLRRMMEMVTPAQRISLESLHPAVKAIIRPRLSPIAEESLSKFTCGGVYFERVRSALQDTHPGSLDPEFVWILARQPYASAAPSPSLRYSGGTEGNEGSVFSLWDGRFWFRVCNPHSRPVVVRPFYPADLTLLRATLSKGQAKDLDELLRVVALGKIRWTLPVIAEAVEDVVIHEAETEDCQEARQAHPEAAGEAANHEAARHHSEAEKANNHETKPNQQQQQQQQQQTKVPTNIIPEHRPKKPSTSGRKPTMASFKERKGGKVLALPTLNWDLGAREKGISWEVRYKKIQMSSKKDLSRAII